jgi:hypothetical protein
VSSPFVDPRASTPLGFNFVECLQKVYNGTYFVQVAHIRAFFMSLKGGEKSNADRT